MAQESDVDYGWDFIQRQQPDSAVASLFGDPDGDPATAAESVRLAADTGVPPSAIYADPERFKRQQTAAWASQLVRENPHLQSFLLDDAMAPKIAKNDIGNLDAASAAIGKLAKSRVEGWQRDELVTRIAPAMWHGAVEGFGGQPMMQWLDSAAPNIYQTNPIAAGAWTLLGYPTEAVFRTINAGVKAAAEGTRVAASDIYHSVTGDRMAGERFGRDIAGMIEAEAMGMSGRGHTPKPPRPEAQVGVKLADVEAARTQRQDAFWQVREELDKVRSWIDGGEEPPPGVSPWLDKIRVNQSKEALRDLEAAAKETNATETRELSPETYRKFVDQHDSAGVEINGDAIAKLYGDKRPELDDGMLGHVVGIGDNLETALATGGDVAIPMRDWLTLEPDVQKALKDDVRVRPGLLTANEIKDKAFEAKAEGELPPPIPDPLPQVRSAAGLEPMFAVGDRRVTLKKVKQEQSYTGDTQFHDFEILDQDGKAVGMINLSSQQGGKQLYVEMIQAGPKEKRMYDPNFLGPSLVRDMLRQLKAAFPEAETITGHRVSGARGKAGSFMEDSASPVVKLRAEGPVDDFRQLLSRIISQDETIQRGEISPGTEVRFRPPEDWTANEREVAQAIIDEWNKIVPGKEARVVQEISEPGREGGVTQAMHIPDWDPAKDLTLFTLMSPDRLGDVHHEAIHQLRRGFFTDAEWAILREAALAENWHGKFGIDRFYRDLHPEMQIEEAIAEAFRDWMKNKEVKYPAEVQGLFERLKQFYENIRKRISEILGHEVTWEDLFHQVSEGEIGSREQGRGIAGAEVMRAEKERIAANDETAFQREHGKTYEDASRAQQIERLVTKDTERGDYDYWVKKAQEEGHNVQGRPSGNAAARAHSEGGKTTLLIRPDGRRIVYQDGTKMVRERMEPMRSIRPPELPQEGTTRIEDREPFRPGAMLPAMTADMQKRYMDLIRERHEADEAAALARAERFQRKQQTAEWKRDREEMRVQVEKEINLRPDVAADLFFNRGELYGEPLGGRPKIDPASLSPELRERLADSGWLKDGGMDAADAANLLGFRDAEAMFDAVSEYQAQRPEGIGAKRQRDAIVERETDRQMELRYGRLEDNIIAEARDQAASETQMQLLHEETMFLAEQAKTEFSLTPAQMKQWATEQFGKSTFSDMNSAKWFQTSGKHGRAAEEALLKGKPADAFRAKQQQYFAMHMAKEALKLEKEKAQFEKSVAKFKKREVKNVDREFTDFVQELMLGAGIPLRMTMDEVQASKLFHGNASLKDFVTDGLGKGWGLEGEISPELQHGLHKDIKTMSVNEFRDLKDAVDVLAFVGRRVNKIFAQGRLQDKQVIVDSIIDNLMKRPKLDPDKEIGTIHKLLAVSKRPEQIIKDLDDHAELGPAFRNLWEPMTVASAKFLELERDLTARLKEMNSGSKAWMKSLNEQIPNDFFYDPHDGTLFNLNRGHLVRIMLNWGNEGNIRKFTEGWAAYDKPTKEQVADFRQRMEDLIQRNARPEDWAYVRDVWDIFQGWQEQLDTVHRNTSGKLPKWVRPDAIKLPDGSTISEGGYFPLIPDKTRLIPGTGFDPLPNIVNGVMQRDYFRPTTTKTHMMDRQINARYRVGFLGDMGEVALRMQQVMHDIAYREGLMDVSGLLFDKKLRNAIKERYSPEYLKQLDAWLVRQANYLNYDEIAMAGMNNVLQRVRQNLVSYALPLNLNVILSPALALTHPGQWMRTLWDWKNMERTAAEHSKVIPHTEYNLDRDFREHIEAMANAKGWDRIRTDAVKAAYKPMIFLEQRLRTVTFFDEFNKAKERGLSDLDASQVADSAVRERHGAQTMTDLPTLMASNEGYKMMTVFMGYFNTMDNWARQIPGQIRREEYGKALATAWGAIIIPAAFGGIMFNKAKEDESYWKIAAKAIGLQLTQGIPFFREAASMVTEGYKPTTPLGSALDAFYQTGRDAVKFYQGKPAGNVVRHVAGAIGLGAGVPGMLQAGKTGQFLYDYSRGKQRPRDLIEWIRGIRTGEARLKKGS